MRLAAAAFCFILVFAYAGEPESNADSGPVLAPGGELSPQEVIDNPDCRMRPGSGPALDAAVVVLIESGAARFLIVDGNGPVYGGEVSFAASNYGLGRRGDGSLMAGFYGVLTHAAGTIPMPPEPAVVYLDGQAIYEHHDVVRLGIAPDGSSFFAIETVTADSFELLIRNLDQGREYRHDIGNTFKSWGLELCYAAYYSPNYSEVHLDPGCPGDAPGIGTHYFYKTHGGGPPRKIGIEYREGRMDEAVLVSSTEGYFVEDESTERDKPRFTIVRRQFNWPEGKSRDIWSLATNHYFMGSGIDIVIPGAWLTLSAFPSGLPSTWDRRDWRLLVLDAATGEIVFDFPTVSEEEQRERLGDFLNPPAVPNGVGNVDWVRIVVDELLIRRTFSRGSRVFAYDVYDLDTISNDAQPVVRIPVNWTPQNDCASRNYPRALADRNGRLAYVSVKE